MTLVVDPRELERAYVSPGELCFFFQLSRNELPRHLDAIGLGPARAIAGHQFVPNNHPIYAVSEVLRHLSGSALAVFLSWAKGDVVVPKAPEGSGRPEPLSAATVPAEPFGKGRLQ